jgi:hypothetical protein
MRESFDVEKENVTKDYVPLAQDTSVSNRQPLQK